MNISSNAFMIIELLQSNGFEAYAVGGCVRDSIMGKPVNDVDITTSALVEDTERILKQNNIKYIETGIKHGTITAIVDSEQFEITTFRTDGEYLDNRHPQNVSFVTDIKEDLARRDFTVNAMAYNKEKGIVDLYGGMNDINNKIIRTVGDANLRFNEDALRIMRALRFASVLGFAIEEDTKKAIFENKNLLKNVSVERIFVELSKLLLGDNAQQILLEYKEIFAVIIPQLEPTFDCQQVTKWHLYDVYTHSVKSVAFTPKNLVLRLTLLFHDIGKPYCKTTDENGQDHFKGHPLKSVEITKQILKNLKVSNEISDKVLLLIEHHDNHLSTKPSTIKRWINIVGKDNILDLMEVKIADMKSHNLDYAQADIDYFYQIKDEIIKILNSHEPISVKDLAVNGNDIMALGFKGKEIGEVLNKLLDIVIENSQTNTKEYLLKKAKEM